MAAPLHADFAEHLELFFGESSDTQCHVYARLSGCAADEGFQLTGTLTGPTCRYAETLPATIRFTDLGPGTSILAKAVVPEPCFWTPEMPQRYLAVVELRRGNEVLARTERDFGLRTLGAAVRALVYDGKRWVLRAVCQSEVAITDLEVWRECDAAMFVAHPNDELCRAASEIGVLLIAQLDRPTAAEIRRLSRYPAVGFAVLPNFPEASRLATLAPNLLFAQHVLSSEPLAPQPWATAVICEIVTGQAPPRCLAASQVPVIAMRPAGPIENVAAGRALCDRLQRDLAGQEALAGYIV